MAHVRPYNPSVRVANWYEDNVLEEDTIKDFLDRREKGELLIQKASNLQENILQEIALSTSRDGYVHFGDVVMFKNFAAKDRTKYENKDPRDDNVLCVNMDISAMHEAKCIQGTCGVTSTKAVRPCVRSAFVIESTGDSVNEQPLRYCQPFYIRTTPGQGGGLYLHSDTFRFNKCAKKSRHQEVTLVSEPSKLTKWKVLPFNPQIRMEFEEAPVPANENVIIVHCETNQAICIEDAFMIRTAFGREYEVSAHTYLDSHRAEKEVNHICISMKGPGDRVVP